MKYEVTFKQGQGQRKEIIEAKEIKVVSGYLYLWNSDGSIHAVFQDWLRAVEVK